MKKIILLGVLTLLLSTGTSAQVHKHSLGLRFNPTGLLRSSQLNYQFGLNPKNRLDFGLSLAGTFGTNDPLRLFGNSSVYLQHVMNIKGGLNWFVGAGPSLYFGGMVNPPTGTVGIFNSYLSFGPQFGLEYDFNQKGIPLILGADIRPSYGFGLGGNNFSGFGMNSGLSLRYTF